MYLKTIRSRKVAAGGCIQKHFDPSPRASACSPICREERSGRPSQTLPATLLCGGHLHLRGFIISTVNSPRMAAALIVARVWYIRIKTGRAGLGQENSQMHPLVGMRAILSYCLSSSALVSLTKLKRLLQKPGFAKKLVVSTGAPSHQTVKKGGRPRTTLSLSHTHTHTFFLSSSVAEKACTHRGREENRIRIGGSKFTLSD